MASLLSSLLKIIFVLSLVCPLLSEAVGSYCPLGKQKHSYFRYCVSCSNGYYRDKPEQTSCIKCPDGYQCPIKSNPPKPCPPGTASRTSVYDRLTCRNCSDGYYQDKSAQGRCLVCPHGYHCPIPKTRVVPCPEGTFSPSKFKERLSCRNCSDGYYQDKSAQRSCLICPDGYYCPVPKTRAIPCPPGTFSPSKLAELLSCRNCYDGSYQDKPGQAFCKRCPVGHSCPLPKTRAIPCPPGTFSSPYRINIDRLACKNCYDGNYQDKPGQAFCIACPDGHHCPTKKARPIPGTTSQRFTRARITCAKCSRCPVPVASPVVCPPGKFLQSSSCQTCKTGQYQTEAGQSHCHSCPAGYYCPTASKKPIPCPIGTYSANMNEVACRPCPPGRYQVQVGQTSCLVCPIGHFCTNASLHPVSCPAGSYARDSNRIQCKPCSSRKYQDQIGQRRCKTCPDGYFCPKPDRLPQQCSPNTYRHQSFRDTSLCLPCRTRQYQDKCGQDMCKDVFEDGVSPTASPGLKCPSLSTYESGIRNTLSTTPTTTTSTSTSTTSPTTTSTTTFRTTSTTTPSTTTTSTTTPGNTTTGTTTITASTTTTTTPSTTTRGEKTPSTTTTSTTTSSTTTTSTTSPSTTSARLTTPSTTTKGTTTITPSTTTTSTKTPSTTTTSTATPSTTTASTTTLGTTSAKLKTPSTTTMSTTNPITTTTSTTTKNRSTTTTPRTTIATSSPRSGSVSDTSGGCASAFRYSQAPVQQVVCCMLLYMWAVSCILW